MLLATNSKWVSGFNKCLIICKWQIFFSYMLHTYVAPFNLFEVPKKVFSHSPIQINFKTVLIMFLHFLLVHIVHSTIFGDMFHYILEAVKHRLDNSADMKHIFHAKEVFIALLLWGIFPFLSCFPVFLFIITCIKPSPVLIFFRFHLSIFFCSFMI